MPELDLVSKGMTTCQGCAMELIARSALEVLGPKTITMTPPSCSAIITGNGDETGWGIPCVQTVLMSLPAFASGVSEALKIQGKNDVNVMGYAGDGGTFDIGFQALSGAIERGHKAIYICCNNEAYMNTVPARLPLVQPPKLRQPARRKSARISTSCFCTRPWYIRPPHLSATSRTSSARSLRPRRRTARASSTS